MAAVWPLKLPPTQKAVLVSLADNANDQGHCWPAIADICTRTCLGRTAVIEAIRGLEQAGLVAAHREPGRGTRYELTVGQPAGVAGKRLGAVNPSATRTGSPDGPVRHADRSASRTGSPAGPVRQADGLTRCKELKAKALDLGTNYHLGNPTHQAPDVARATGVKADPDDGDVGEAPQAVAVVEVAGPRAEVALTRALWSLGKRLPASHPKLIEAAAAGVTARDIADMAAVYPDKPAAYIVAAATSQRREAAAAASAALDAFGGAGHGLPRPAASPRASPPQLSKTGAAYAALTQLIHDLETSDDRHPHAHLVHGSAGPRIEAPAGPQPRPHAGG